MSALPADLRRNSGCRPEDFCQSQHFQQSVLCLWGSWLCRASWRMPHSWSSTPFWQSVAASKKSWTWSQRIQEKFYGYLWLWKWGWEVHDEKKAMKAPVFHLWDMEKTCNWKDTICDPWSCIPLISAVSRLHFCLLDFTELQWQSTSAFLNDAKSCTWHMFKMWWMV